MNIELFNGVFWVTKISYKEAMDIVIKNHYLHRKCPCSYAFGLTDGHKIFGVVTYGVPCSSTLLKGICGVEEAHNVYELNRLWIDDTMPRNSASFLVSHSIKQLDKEIIVSFADTFVGHVGYVYQATNFLYCGLSAKFKDIRVKGKEGQHHATFAYGMTNKEVIEKFGKENCYFIERPRKHRYIYFNASKTRKKLLMKKLKYKIFPYPKGETIKHSKEETYNY